jgi:hypothetical protein
MRRHKKLIVAAVLAGVLLFASLGGVALATDPEEGGLKAKYGDFIDKVITNYESETGDTLNREVLEAAIIGAKNQMREAAMDKRPQALTDEQKEVLQEWCDSKPGLTDEQKEALQAWWDSRPEDLPMKFGGHKDGGFLRGMCKPPAPAE